MTRLRWDPCLDTGIEEIDWEHRRLLNIANRLLDAIARGKGDVAVHPVSRDLMRHAEEHFAHEEAHMRDTGYPGLAAHIMEHQRLHKSAEEFVAALHSDDPPGSQQLNDLMSHWLLGHILKLDKHFAVFCREKAGKESCP